MFEKFSMGCPSRTIDRRCKLSFDGHAMSYCCEAICPFMYWLKIIKEIIYEKDSYKVA